MKAVALILQFVMFFIIGLTFFIAVSNIVKFQSTEIRQDILNSGSDLSIKEISAEIINTVNSCKSCDNTTIKFNQKPIAGFGPTYKLSNGIILSVLLQSKSLQSSIHNLYYSITYDTKEVGSSKTLNLTYDKTNNKLVIR